jgi:hypothetical protein
MEEQDQNVSGASQGTPSRAELEQSLRARAWKDKAFRQKLLASPRTVLERDYAAYFPGGKIPSDLSIKIVEEEEQALCFVLPPRVPDALLGMEDLDEEDVSAVAGGKTNFCPTSNCTRIRCTIKSYCHYCNDNVISELTGKIKI